jgi:hypothetical protein
MMSTNGPPLCPLRPSRLIAGLITNWHNAEHNQRVLSCPGVCPPVGINLPYSYSRTSCLPAINIAFPNLDSPHPPCYNDPVC